MESVRRKYGFQKGTDVGAVGSKGGLSLVVADFNEIAFSFQKKGGCICEEIMKAFRTALLDCDLSDLGFTGTWFTWERGILVANNIRERLDMGFQIQSGGVSFLNFQLHHYLILVDTRGRYNIRTRKGQMKFYFDTDWCLEGSVEDEIQGYWASITDDLPVKLKGLGKKLQH
ncbi:hypothetical protein J1N35_022846 [Gossypium stocksii]|uniref:Reverse transcriptase n=1 Tax=Gossypium stocksii TaxID=47602 RepID=A0A9D3VH86_9ROSI|nr:hypothetical protein J1N35_022846 [Gossypium stocksii]